jgi:predicted amidohydrolase YtcJ
MKRLTFPILIFMIAACSSPQIVDRVVFNGTIYTVDSLFTVAEAMAIDSGKIVATGSTEEILGSFKGRVKTNLGGAFVYPGFIDPHCHFTGYGLGLREADLLGTSSFVEVISRLKDHQIKNKAAWVIGSGWDQNDWREPDFADISEIDRAFPYTPVYLIRVDGHAAIVNTAALKLAGITKNTKVEGGEILYSKGVLIDNAMELVYKLLPVPATEEISKALLDAQKNCFAVGLTSVGEAGLDRNVIVLIDSLQRAGLLSMRINAMINPTSDNFENYLYKGIFQNEKLTIRSIKLFADGALGSRGALMLKPYSDQLETKGLMIKPLEYYRTVCALALQYGYQVNTHCIGDSANRMLLNLYGEFLKGKNDLRWRIEHAQIVDSSDVHKFGEYSIIPSIQTTHATSDMYWAEKRLGSRIKDAYKSKSLLDENGWIPNGSDFPVENINPIYGFYAAVSRQDQKGWPPDGFLPSEALSREEALRAMTIWAARAAFEENYKGSLETGKLADFVVTQTDLITADKANLFKTKVLRTFIAGIQVFGESE